MTGLPLAILTWGLTRSQCVMIKSASVMMNGALRGALSWPDHLTPESSAPRRCFQF
jgi:hypothetical protein